MMSPLVVSMTAVMGAFARLQGVAEPMDVLDFDKKNLGGFSNAETTPHVFAPSARMPAYVSQVREYLRTSPEDGQTTYDLLDRTKKDLFWIDGTTRRFDGYNYFGQNPERMLGWFNRFMA